MTTRRQGMGPGPQIERLGALVGKWRTEGHIVAGESMPAVPITGTDTYEWLGGRFFLVHHVDVHVGSERVEAIEIIGEYDASTDAYLARSFDNQGNVVEMIVSVSEDGVWTFTGGSDVASPAQPATGAATGRVRSTLVVAADRQTMSATWDRSPDGSSWLPWMDVSFTRIS